MPSSPRPIGVWGVLAALLAASLPVHARAFERTPGDRPDTYLHWPYRSVDVFTASASSSDLPPERVAAAVTRALDEWNEAAVGCSDLTLRDAGRASSLETNLTGALHDGENRIVFREEEWPSELSPFVLAQTTLVYDARTGALLDADIDVNGVHHFWTDDDQVGRVVNDVQSTITHELGHLLGLAHSPDPEATMFAETFPGELGKRTLAPDDVDGLCFVYPAGLLTPDAPARHLPPLTGSCAASPAGRDGSVGAMLGALLWARRRRLGRRGSRSRGRKTQRHSQTGGG